MPSDESKGSQLDAIGSLAQRQLDNTLADAAGRICTFKQQLIGDERTLLAHISQGAALTGPERRRSLSAIRCPKQ